MSNWRCGVLFNGESVVGILLGISDGRVTLKVDGYAASDTVPLGALAWALPEELATDTPTPTESA